MKVYQKKQSMIIIIIIYIIAIITGIFIYKSMGNASLLLSLFVADIAATIVVFLAGIIFKNSSVYDPYWSVQPIVLIISMYYIRSLPLSIIDLVLLLIVMLWGIRLTCNWAINFKGLSNQDWRYTMLKNSNEKLWFITNLFGINIMPTLLVYIATIPMYYIIFNTQKLSWVFILGAVLGIIAPIFQLIADKQLKWFKKTSSEKFINSGLWKYSRHPNYLGEISFWWAIFLMQIGSVNQPVITIIGAILITILFLFVSIPMMENHLIEKDRDYLTYQKNVSILKPFFIKKASS